MRSPRTLVIQHVADEGPGALADALRACGSELLVVRADEGAVPRRLDADALVLLGGPMGVYERDAYPHLKDELRLVEHAIGRGLPVLGICLGSQIVATVLGATVRSSGTFELGWAPVVRCDPHDGVLGPPCPSFTALHWHGDVFDTPPGATRLASSAMTTDQAFVCGTSLGLLFHLEPEPTTVAAMATAFPDDLARASTTRDELLSATERHAAAAHRRLAAIVFGWLARAGTIAARDGAC